MLLGIIQSYKYYRNNLRDTVNTLDEYLFSKNGYIQLDNFMLYTSYHYLTDYVYLLCLILGSMYIGYSSHYVMEKLNIHHGWGGVLYYDEAHVKVFNRMVHSFFMMFTALGFLLSAPALSGIREEDVWAFHLVVYLTHFFHYFQFDKLTACIVAVHYLPTVLCATFIYSNIDTFDSLFYGVLLSFCSLLIQETLGHLIGGDIPSRPEGVVNAIFYAVYSSSYTIKLLFHSCLTCRDKFIDHSTEVRGGGIFFNHKKLI